MMGRTVFGSFFVLLSVVALPHAAEAVVSAQIVDKTAEIPQTMFCGETRVVSITVRNTGQTTWSRDAGFALGKADLDDPLFERGEVRLTGDVAVAPGEKHIFDVPLTAPSAPGEYITLWQMTQDRGVWFGNTLKRRIYVVCDEPVDTSTLSGTVMVGYQGWFGCPKDGSDRGSWRHWFKARKKAAPHKATFDLWPDVSELPEEQLCYNTGFKYRGNALAPLYSNWHPETVDTHFRWMREYGIDGAYLQWFTKQYEAAEHPKATASDKAEFQFRVDVTKNVMASAEEHGRGFAVLLDISGHPEKTMVEDIKLLWRHLVDKVKVTQSSSYMFHKGRPVLAIRNLGRTNRPGTPQDFQELIDYFHFKSPPRLRATLVGGLPAYWRTLGEDSQDDEAWADVYRGFDVIHGWTVGRYENERAADAFSANVVAGDVEEVERLGKEYMAVVFPGFSNHNLTRVAENRRAQKLNAIKRDTGRFYWRQIFNALSLDIDMLYIAMFDEVDEGTAIYKTVSRRKDLPRQGKFVPLSEKGVELPNDWYLRLTGEAKRAMGLRLLVDESLPILP